MKIVVGKNSGFCVGVQRAVDTALSFAGDNVYILGEIVHNPVVIADIAARGIKVVNSLAEVEDGATVIFRSHGVGERAYAECERRGIKIVDCTCSYVKRTQRIVKEQSAAGRQVVIIGKRDHPEVEGLIGWCKCDAVVLDGEEEFPPEILQKELAIVCQTTFSVEKFKKIIKNIRKVCEKTVDVFETICYTTVERQKEVDEMSRNLEAIIVLGGLNSSNTNKLCELASANCKNVFRLSSADKFNYNKLKNFKSVGIVSGASTPNTQIREVLKNMENTEVKAANTMEDVVAKIENESKFKKGQIVTATISQATDEGLQILLPFSKKEVALSKNELDCENYDAAEYMAKIGEPIDLLVVDLKPNLKLSQKMIKLMAEEESFNTEIENGKEFSVVCTGFNKGGLVGQHGTYSVFVPAREIRPGFVKDLSKYEGKTLRLRAIEIKKGNKKEIIASQRVILQEERDQRDALKAEKEEQFFASVAVGDIVEGKVERATAFGAFVSVNGFDCLAHISDLSWTGVEKVTDVLEIGQTYQFKVLKVDTANKKVSIGYKQLQPEPWDTVEERYSIGDVIHGKVVRLVAFGAFVEVEKGIDGLVHVSQISHERIEVPATCLSVGQEVDAKIINIDAQARKMNLSIKALLPEGERKHAPEGEDDGAPRGKKGGRAPRRTTSDDEVSSWSEGSIGGTSIADLLANAKK